MMPISPELEIYAHRGASSLIAESTLPAYAAAIAIGADTIDMDIALTKDNIIVVNHDQRISSELTRDANGKWLAKDGPYIRDLTFAELQRYDVGALNPAGRLYKKFPDAQALNQIHTPTLQEVIRMANAATHNTIHFQIEIKTTPQDDLHHPKPDEIVPILINLLREEHILDRTEIHSFDWRNLVLAQTLEPSTQLSFLTSQNLIFNNVNPKVSIRWTAGYQVEDYENSVPKMIAALGGKVWCPRFSDLTEELVISAHKLHLKVVPWTVDSPADMQKMIRFGVDGIITNYPQVLLGLRAANKVRLEFE